MARSYELELSTAVEAVREAARLCRIVQLEIAQGMLEKEDGSPVTIADFGSQALVCRLLGTEFPGDPIIAEENASWLRRPEKEDLRDRVISHVMHVHPLAGTDEILDWIDHGNSRTYSDRFWTLDPVDGTKGFLRGDQYVVALALIEEGEPVVSAMACPNYTFEGGTDTHTGAIFAAVRGEGTLRMPMDVEDGPHIVRVSSTAEPSKAKVCESVEQEHSSQAHTEQVMERLGIRQEPIRLDSQNKYALVASSDADIYLRFPTRPGYIEKIWDHASGALLVTEAGGKVTDINGNPLEFNHGAELVANRGVVVTNGWLHEDVMQAVRAVGGS